MSVHMSVAECEWMLVVYHHHLDASILEYFFLNRINVPNVLLDSKGCEGCGIWMDLVGEEHHPKNTLW